MIITVVLSPAIDVIYDMPSFSIGKLNRAVYSHVCAGGKGINVSRVLNILGVENSTLFFSGGETGRFLEQLLSSEGINFSTVNTAAKTRINVKLAKNAEPDTEINAPSTGISEAELEAFISLYSSSIHQGDCVVLSGRLPDGLSAYTYARFAKIAKDMGAHFVVDTSGKAFSAAIAEGPLIIKPNIEELEELAGYQFLSRDEIIAFCRGLNRLGVGTVLATMDKNGALCLGAGCCLFAPPANIEPKCQTGAGDAFLAGYLWGVANGLETKHCMRMAAACAFARVSLNPQQELLKGTILKMFEGINIIELSIPDGV